MSSVLSSRSRATGQWSRLIVAGAVTGVFLVAAVASLVTNFSIRGALPRLPLSSLIGPAKIAELRFAQAVARGQVSPALARSARAAGAGAPLAYEPFLLAGAAGFRGERTNGSASDAALLREAARRNPRSRAAHYMLMRHAVATGDVGEAFHHIAALSTLGEPASATLLLAVGRAVRTKGEVDEATTALGLYPRLLDGFISGFSAVPKPAPVVLHLATKLPRSGFDREKAASLLAGALLKGGDYGNARAVWQRMTKRSAGGGVADPTFASAVALPPFGWSFAQSQSGVAERQQDKTVFVDYYGRRPGVLVQQLLTLAPGTYSAVIEYESASANDRAIALVVSCANSGTNIAQLPLVRTRGFAKAKVPFQVPPDCGGQNLALAGLLTDHRTPQQVIVRHLNVVQGSAR